MLLEKYETYSRFAEIQDEDLQTWHEKIKLALEAFNGSLPDYTEMIDQIRPATDKRLQVMN
jgi:hypothetical protein